MKSTERLKAEHGLIERGLALLERAVARLEAGQPLPVLKRRGIPEQGGPIGVMLHEHVLGRDCVGRMREASEAQPFDARTFADAARQYIPLLRQHIFEENNVLFHMAERVMSEADDADVTGRFSQVEQERGLTGWHEGFAGDLAQWEQALG
jgi:hemerythrin-like domain-containing protein